jgi:hypothetical protein
VVRPARFVELFLISKGCRSVPFDLLILAPLALKFTAAWLLYGLIRDLRLPRPWPELGTAVWLLGPLGTEAALWPSALHVLLGLVFSLSPHCACIEGAGWAGPPRPLSEHAYQWSRSSSRCRSPCGSPLPRRAAARPRGWRSASCCRYWSPTACGRATTPSGSDTCPAGAFAVSKGGWYVFFPAIGTGLHSGLRAFLNSAVRPWTSCTGSGGAFLEPRRFSTPSRSVLS